MADISASNWSETDASNTTAAPDGAPEGMAPSGVNDTMRAMMGAMKRLRDRNGPSVTSAGTNTVTLTYTVAPAAYVTGDVYSFIAGGTNTGPVTLNVNALGAKAVQWQGFALRGGEIVASGMVTVGYDGTQFQLLSSSLPSTTVQVLTSGTAATYTTPTGCRQLWIWAKAGGGGGGGSGTASSGDGGTGGTTTFNSINAVGGSGGGGSQNSGVGGASGTGGTGSATWRTPGAAGQSSNSLTANVPGGSGGGKGAGTGSATSGVAAIANSGGGGGGGTPPGGGANLGGGGGAEGEEFFLIINGPSATYTYTVGAAGTAGTAGTGGSVGGAGGSGVIRVLELY